MDHLITTPFGKVLARVNNQQIDLFDTATLKPLAKLQNVQGNTREVMLTAIRRLVTLTRLSLDIGNMKMEILGSFSNPVESSAPKKTRKKRSKKEVEPQDQPVTIESSVETSEPTSVLGQVVKELASKSTGQPVTRARSPRIA